MASTFNKKSLLFKKPVPIFMNNRQWQKLKHTTYLISAEVEYIIKDNYSWQLELGIMPKIRNGHFSVLFHDSLYVTGSAFEGLLSNRLKLILLPYDFNLWGELGIGVLWNNLLLSSTTYDMYHIVPSVALEADKRINKIIFGLGIKYLIYHPIGNNEPFQDYAPGRPWIFLTIGYMIN